MTITLLEPTVIAMEALMMFENNMVMGAHIHRKYKKEFKKVGDTITIRKPVKFTVTKARTRTESGVTEPSVTLQVATQAHVSWDFTSVDLTMTIEEYSERYIKPAANVLANTVDADLTALYDDVYNEVHESSGFVTPASFIVLGKAGQRLDEEAVPQDGRVLVLNPAGNWSLANALRTVYVKEVAKPILQRGYLATIANFEIFMDQNIKAHTVGDFASSGCSVVVGSVGATINGTSLALGQFTVVDTEVLKVGDVFTIAAVYAVNPVSGLSTGELRQFVVTADASCAGTETTTGRDVTVYISPEIIDTGAYKTVNQDPVNGAAVTIVGSAGMSIPQNLAFHKNAFALVTVPLEMPHGVWGARASNKKTGLSIRVLKAYDVDDDEEICRMDILYGVKTLYPELACRLSGKAV